MVLTTKQKQFLRAQAHRLKPVVLMGQKGLHNTIFEEISSALKTHELIKIKIVSDDKAEAKKLIETICEQCNCHFIQLIGHIAVVFKRNEQKPRYQLPSKSSSKKLS